MIVLFPDTSVLIDLDRAGLTRLAFALPHEFAVADLLYATELEAFDREGLLALGLRIEVLDGLETTAALAIRQARPGLSVAEAFALALARTRDWHLLSGDGSLGAAAGEHGVVNHGTLWLLDELEQSAICPAKQLGDGLTTLAAHRRCRLPAREVSLRLGRYGASG